MLFACSLYVCNVYILILQIYARNPIVMQVTSFILWSCVLTILARSLFLLSPQWFFCSCHTAISFSVYFFCCRRHRRIPFRSRVSTTSTDTHNSIKRVCIVLIFPSLFLLRIYLFPLTTATPPSCKKNNWYNQISIKKCFNNIKISNVCHEFPLYWNYARERKRENVFF